MGYYNVVKPCVVGKLHYARPTTQPIEVDDEVAAPLVEDGSLEPYGPRQDTASAPGVSIPEQSDMMPQWPDQVEQSVAGERPSLPVDAPKPRRGGRRRTTED